MPPASPLAALQLDGEGAQRLRDAFFGSKTGHTLRAYRGSVATFAAHLSSKLGRPLTETEAIGEMLRAGQGGANLAVLEFRDALRAKPMAAVSVNRALSCVRSVVTLARTLGLVAWELDVPNLKGAAPYRDTRGPGKRAVISMLGALKRRPGPKAIRDRALLRLLFDLALRRAEASTIDLEHLDLAGSRVLVLRKGKTERIWRTLAPQTVQVIEAWLAVRGATPGPLFLGFRGGKGKRLAAGGVWGAVKAMGHNIGVETHPHALRHTAITGAIKAAQANGIELERVLDFSGHASVATLMIYRDAEADMQGRLSRLVAESAGE